MGTNNLNTIGMEFDKGTREWTSCLIPIEVEQWFKLVPKLRKSGMSLDEARDKAKTRILNRRK